jgi:hypothetical protein
VNYAQRLEFLDWVTGYLTLRDQERLNEIVLSWTAAHMPVPADVSLPLRGVLEWTGMHLQRYRSEVLEHMESMTGPVPH